MLLLFLFNTDETSVAKNLRYSNFGQMNVHVGQYISDLKEIQYFFFILEIYIFHNDINLVRF